jgi:hypothetical protein
LRGGRILLWLWGRRGQDRPRHAWLQGRIGGVGLVEPRLCRVGAAGA